MTLGLLKQIVLKYFKTKNFSRKNVSKQGWAEVYIITIEDVNYVVRITTKPYSIPHNIYALEKLKDTNVAPKLIANGKIDDYEYSIETFLPGVIKSKLSNVELNKLLEKITQVHSIENEKFGYLGKLSSDWNTFFEEQMILRFKSEFEKHCSNFSRYINYALENIPQITKSSLLHGDLAETNILFTKDEAFLFDFEGCQYGDKEYDIANLNFRIDLTNEDIALIVKKGNYSRAKILYYTICVLIRKIAKSPSDRLKYKIDKLQRTYEEIQKF